MFSGRPLKLHLNLKNSPKQKGMQKEHSARADDTDTDTVTNVLTHLSSRVGETETLLKDLTPKYEGVYFVSAHPKIQGKTLVELCFLNNFGCKCPLLSSDSNPAWSIHPSNWSNIFHLENFVCQHFFKLFDQLLPINMIEFSRI